MNYKSEENSVYFLVSHLKAFRFAYIILVYSEYAAEPLAFY